MNGQPWTPIDDALLRRLYPKHSKAAVAEQMGRSVFSVKSRATKLGLIKRPRYWSAADQATFRRLYPHTDNTVLATLFNRTIKAIHQQAKTLGVQKTREYLSDYSRRLNAEREAQGRTPGRFHAGQTPWNKGRKGWTPPGTERTQFKKGNIPHTWRPIGTEEVRDGYLYRKIREDGPTHLRCRPVHVLIWEDANGPVPAGHAIVFKDTGDKTTNITLERLECISRAELMARNTVHRYPPDIRGAITMRARLTRVINEKTKHLETQQ
jgi:hypothetical protein